MRGRRETGDPLDANRVLLELLDQEVDRQRGDVAARSSALASRASVLIASASIITTLQIGTGGLTFVSTIVLTAVSAVAGIVVLVMRGAPELSIEVLETELWSMTADEVRRDLVHQKLYVLRADEKRLRRRARVLNVGFGALAASLIAAALHLIGGIQI